MSVLDRLEPSVRDQNNDEQMDRLLKLRNRPRSRVTKIIKAGTGRSAAIAVSPEIIDLSAPGAPDEDPIGVSVVGGSGTVLRGPVGFTNTPGEIRIAGFWVLNDLLLSAAPSTVITPIPVMRFSPPLESVAKHIASAAVIAAMVGII